LIRRWPEVLEPIPETREALAELTSIDDPELDEVLASMARRARAVVPELVGLSLGLVKEDLTFTLVATNSAVASIDAVQYLDDGPCLEAVRNHPTAVETEVEDLLNEERWRLFAETSAAAGVASTLSMPILRNGQVIGGVNLYASTPEAFTGRHGLLALALDADATAAIANADLSFSTRIKAAEAPQKIRDTQVIETAVGLLATRLGRAFDEARELLRQAAARAGITEAWVARVLILTHPA
jgi:GAF domain-containing protein